MNPISFMGANFVAKQSGYQAPANPDWMFHDGKTQEFFQPLATYRQRIGELLEEVKNAGFGCMDLWVAHLHPLWATTEHIAIFIEEAALRKISITSLAGGFGNTLPEFRAFCRLAVEVGAPVMGGMTKVLTEDREGMVGALRETGRIFALENHAEKNPEELLGNLGEGDEDVLQVAVDTGWFATQGYPADKALEKLVGRLAIVHLKDIEAAGAHDTCGLGEGVANIEACLEVLRDGDYTGVISIEHEPYERDPVPEVVAGRDWVSKQFDKKVLPEGFGKPVGMAILGCGNIAGTYAKQMASYPEVRVEGVFDIDQERAREFAATWNLRCYASMEELLGDPGVEVVVNLTIHHAHYEMVRRCLEAGKHVHTEKPLATNYPQAAELVQLAKEHNLRLSSAPTTWLGEAQQTMWAHLAAGRIGQPRIAYAEVNWGRIEAWHPNPGPFYAVGPVFDVAVYPLSLLTAWFGPVQSVVTGGAIVFPHRTTKEGKDFEVTSPDWTCAVLTFESGLLARLTSSFYVANANSQSGLEIHGDLGSLRIGKWDSANADLEFAPTNRRMQSLPLAKSPFHGTEFAKGLRDLACAIREDRPHRCSGAQAAHVVEICEAILQSIERGAPVEIRSDFPAPAPLPWASSLVARLKS